MRGKVTLPSPPLCPSLGSRKTSAALVFTGTVGRQGGNYLSPPYPRVVCVQTISLTFT